MKFGFSYGGPSRVLLTALGCGHRFSSIEVDGTTLRVRLGWAFRATIPRPAITGAAPDTRRPISRGAHGWRGRWLVNGSGKGLVTLTIDPPVRAATMGWPVQLRELTVSVDAPDELVEALAVG